MAGGVESTAAQVDDEHRLDFRLVGPGGELRQAELVGFECSPGEVQAGGALLWWAHAIFPVVAGHEVSARVAYQRDSQFAHQVEYVFSKPELVGARMPGLENPRVDAASQVLDE